MPTFDFQCGKCKATFEFTRPFGSDEYPTCPECGSKKTEKLIAPPAVVFKGGGWYKTDSRSEKEHGTKGTKGTEETKGATKAEKGEGPKKGKKESDNAA